MKEKFMQTVLKKSRKNKKILAKRHIFYNNESKKLQTPKNLLLKPKALANIRFKCNSHNFKLNKNVRDEKKFLLFASNLSYCDKTRLAAMAHSS